MYIAMRVCRYVWIFVCVLVSLSVSMFVGLLVFVCTLVSLCFCMFVCVFVCACVCLMCVMLLGGDGTVWVGCYVTVFPFDLLRKFIVTHVSRFMHTCFGCLLVG